MVEIRHLSVTARNPEKAAKALAEMTGGQAQPFISKNMPGAWVCIWDTSKNHLIEFLPDGFLMQATDYGADFKKMDSNVNYKSTHFQLEVDATVNEIKLVADKNSFRHAFRANRGGPLYDVWFEDQLLVEFTSDEIRKLSQSL